MARRRASAFVPVLVTSLRVRFQSYLMALGWERRRRLYGIRYSRLLSPSSVRAPVPVSGLRVLVQEFRWPQWQAVFRSLPLTRCPYTTHPAMRCQRGRYVARTT